MKIISDGTPNGTKLLDDNDVEIQHITSIQWNISVENIGTAIIEFNNIEIEAVYYTEQRYPKLNII